MPVQYAVTIKTLGATFVIHVKVENLSARHAPPSQTQYAIIVVNARLVKNQTLALSVQELKTLCHAVRVHAGLRVEHSIQCM